MVYIVIIPYMYIYPNKHDIANEILFIQKTSEIT